MARFDRQIAMAQRLIKKNGQAVQWKVIANGAPNDPDTPWNPGEVPPVQHTVDICFLPIDTNTRATFAFLQDMEIPTGSVMGLMGQVSFDPSPKDVVLRNGEELRILALDVLSPNGQKILYTMVFNT